MDGCIRQHMSSSLWMKLCSPRVGEQSTQSMLLRSSSPNFARKLFRICVGYEIAQYIPAVSESDSFPIGFVVEIFLWLRHTKQASVETIEAMVFDDMHTLDNNGQVDNEPMPPSPFPLVNLGGFLASGKTLGRDIHQSGGTGEWWSEGLGLIADGDVAVLVLAPVHLQ